MIMKKTIFVVLAMLYAYTLSAQDIQGFVTKQMQTYPKSRLLDIYKSCFQDYMGAEHLVSDGYRVETPIGSFGPKLKLLGEHTDLFLAIHNDLLCATVISVAPSAIKTINNRRITFCII